MYRIALLYVSTSCLWRQAVADTIVVTLHNALRMHSRCTGRPMEGLQNGHHTAIHSTRSPSRMCGSVTAGVYGCPRGVAPIKHHPAMKDSHVVAHGRSNDPIVASFLVMRCPRSEPLFASL